MEDRLNFCGVLRISEVYSTRWSGPILQKEQKPKLSAPRILAQFYRTSFRILIRKPDLFGFHLILFEKYLTKRLHSSCNTYRNVASSRLKMASKFIDSVNACPSWVYFVKKVTRMEYYSCKHKGFEQRAYSLKAKRKKILVYHFNIRS